VKKSTELNVGLGGTPVITIGETVRAGGQVRLLSGKIDVQGKSFDIDSGTVTFNGDPTDPQVVVTASWTAADGTRVFAELRGTLKKPVVTLRSEPSYPKDQIIALLLYGSSDATSPNSGAAAGVAGGAATQPLNRALENMGLGGVSTRVDTSAVTPRADVEVQIARNLSFQIAELMGAPPPGSNPDLTLFTLSWRFAKAWSAQTTIGDAGTTILDLIWQRRY
jgi:translocation and assembly module TamB